MGFVSIVCFYFKLCCVYYNMVVCANARYLQCSLSWSFRYNFISQLPIASVVYRVFIIYRAIYNLVYLRYSPNYCRVQYIFVLYYSLLALLTQSFKKCVPQQLKLFCVRFLLFTLVGRTKKYVSFFQFVKHRR